MVKSDVSGVREAANRAPVPAPAHMAAPLCSQKNVLCLHLLMEVCSHPCVGTQGTPQTLVLTLRNISYN